MKKNRSKASIGKSVQIGDARKRNGKSLRKLPAAKSRASSAVVAKGASPSAVSPSSGYEKPRIIKRGKLSDLVKV